MILTVGDMLQVELPRSERLNGSFKGMTMEEVERRHIQSVLEKTGGRISGSGGAADLLGLKPTTLSSRMKKLGISRK